MTPSLSMLKPASSTTHMRSAAPAMRAARPRAAEELRGGAEDVPPPSHDGGALTLRNGQDFERPGALGTLGDGGSAVTLLAAAAAADANGSTPELPAKCDLGEAYRHWHTDCAGGGRSIIL